MSNNFFLPVGSTELHQIDYNLVNLLIITTYEVQENSDLTEGKGHMVTKTIWHDLDKAVKDVQDRGVHGVGTGDILEVITTFETDGSVSKVPAKIWGYRKDWKGKWGYGWLDNRDAPTHDPEYGEYVRLHKKFKDM